MIRLLLTGCIDDYVSGRERRFETYDPHEHISLVTRFTSL